MKVGDKIQVIEPGACYMQYESLARFLNIQDWSKGRIPQKGSQGFIKSIIIKKDQLEERTFIHIKESPGFWHFIFTPEGLKVVS